MTPPSPKPKILALVQLPPPIHGVSRMNEVVLSSRELMARYDVRVFPLRSSQSASDLGRFRLSKLLAALWTTVLLLWVCVSMRPTVVYFTIAPTGLGLMRDLMLLGVLRVTGIRRVLHVHGLGVRASAGRPLARAAYQLMFRGSSVIHLAKIGVDDIAGYVDPADIHIVPNGVEDIGRDQWLEERRGRRAAPQVLFLSNMFEAKGPLLVLEALGRLRKEGVPFQLTLAGGAGQAKLERQIAARSAELNLSHLVNRVESVGMECRSELFRMADVFVFPTFHEPECFPLVVLEAMSAGLAIVASRHAAIPEILEEGRAGLLVPVKSVDELTAALRRVLLDEEMREQLGRSARDRFLNRYTARHFEASITNALQVSIA